MKNEKKKKYIHIRITRDNIFFAHAYYVIIIIVLRVLARRYDSSIGFFFYLFFFFCTSETIRNYSKRVFVEKKKNENNTNSVRFVATQNRTYTPLSK
jgi:hypothetical protein